MYCIFSSFSRKARTALLLVFLLCSCRLWAQQRWLPEHPRLLFTGAETAKVKNLIQTDTLAARLAEYLKHEAD